MNDLRSRLRSLPAFPAELPGRDVAHLPEDPRELFLRWLEEAIDAGERQPHAMTVATVGADGSPALRTLLVKDVDEDGFRFASKRSSRKARDIAADPRGALLFFWRSSGRQAEVSGRIAALSDEESQRDWRARPSYDGSPNPDWRVWTLRPDRIQFLQARHDRAHTRVEYLRDAAGWTHRELDPRTAG
ncbi:pyridoxine/pyridoxamine 5'-phosphate oxidase [Microbacterium sp. gxy059]|uniref:pyridoxine/pyridoxamine 5'-phosphate oxidase n=1 Tax=Microbacterium sp. gxy059 TaxID=2957199 RepID=UPI003D984A48